MLSYPEQPTSWKTILISALAAIKDSFATSAHFPFGTCWLPRSFSAKKPRPVPVHCLLPERCRWAQRPQETARQAQIAVPNGRAGWGCAAGGSGGGGGATSSAKYSFSDVIHFSDELKVGAWEHLLTLTCFLFTHIPFKYSSVLKGVSYISPKEIPNDSKQLIWMQGQQEFLELGPRN